MKKITQNLRWLVTLLAMVVCTGAWAETVTVTASKISSSSVTWTGSDNVSWNVAVSGGATDQNVNSGYAQVGTTKSPSSSITISRSSITNATITKIEIDCASYQGKATVSATVGGNAFGTQSQSTPSWSNNSGGVVTFTGSASGEIVITMTNGTSGRAMYIKSITVTYANSGETPTPSITVDPATVNATAEEADGTLAISYENLSISEMNDFDIKFYDANNQELTTEPDWVEVLVAEAEGGENYVVSYVIDANKGEARTAYCKVYAIDDDEYVYSNLITIKQAEYVAPSIATLPFVFDGGRADIEDTEGLTQEGLGTDYDKGAPKLKFDSSGDWVLLQFDETPGNLSFDIKGNSFSGGTFTVQTSTDGKTYTNLETYTELGDTQTETFENLSSDVRFIKWVYTEKSTGNVGLGNIKLERSSTAPQIIVANTTIDVDANENSGTLEVTYKNIDPELADIYFYAADGETAATYDWIVAELDGNNNIEYIISANEGEARTAYLKVYGLDAETNDIYSSLITINQAAYVAPVSEFATLPFEFDDGKNAIESTDGLTQEGLDSDYGSSPKLKFDNTGDWVLLQIDEAPGKLSFDIKGNSFSGGTFTVQTSKDGETYTNLKSYTELGDTQTETFYNLSSDVRYIKWIYTNKSSGNVGLGNIKLTKYLPYTLTINDCDNADIYVFYNDDQTNSIANSEDMLSNNNVLSNSEILISASAKEGYVLESVTVTDGNGDKISLNDVEGEEGTAWTFTMPESNVTISCNVKEDVPHEELTFVKVTSTDELVAGGEYIIIAHYPEDSEGYYAMTTTQNTNNRGADGIYVSEDIAYIEPEHVQVITLEGNSEGWYFNTGDGYLYAASSSKNWLRTKADADDDATATIEISPDGDATIAFQGNYTRNNLRFNNNDILFSCYEEASEMPLVQLYKKVEAETSSAVTIGSANWATYVAEANVTFPTGVSAYTVETINTDHVTLGVVSAVKEGTPILVYSETPGTYPLEVVEEGVCDETFNNQLKVSDGTVKGGATIYALANKDNVVGFYPVASNVTIPDGKAYLDTSSAKHHVKGFLALGGVADAINNIAVETANGTIFNIAGQKVQNITKSGLYIVNGKKVFVK